MLMRAVSTFSRYLLFQLPGWGLAAVFLLWLWPKTSWAPSLGVAAWVAWAAKDLALYPLVRTAYERDTPTGAARLVGCIGVTSTALEPFGQVRVRGELWRARVCGDTRIGAGRRVRVEKAEGLTLHVQEADSTE